MLDVTEGFDEIEECNASGIEGGIVWTVETVAEVGPLVMRNSLSRRGARESAIM